MVHNPGYDFHDANIPIGAAYWVMLAERFLAAATATGAAAAATHEELLATH
jgi:hypothetical protein